MNARLEPADVEPVAELFAEYGDLVFRTLQYLGVPSGSVDDALQDVFITAHRRWDTFEGRSSPRTWLYGIARRVAWRYRRNIEHRGSKFVLTQRPVEGAHAPFDQAHARRSVQALLAGIDEDKRSAFVLTEVEGFTAAEAAQLLEIPLGTVYSRVRAAWAKLRAAAQEDLELGEARPPMEPERRATLERAVLAACVPTAGAGAVASTGLAGLGWVWAIAAAGVAAVGVGIGVSQREPEPKPKPEPPALVQTQRRVPAASPTPDAAEPAVPQTTPAPSEPKAAPAPSTTTPAPSEPRAAPRPEPASPEPQVEPAEPISPNSPETLRKELALIRHAKELAREGKAAQARAALDRHEREFPDGQLVEERKEVRASLDEG